MDVGVAVSVAGMALLGLVWLVRLEGRVNSHEASCDQRQMRLDERHTRMERQLESINAKLDRVIEAR